jgi:hypothetical protein
MRQRGKETAVICDGVRETRHREGGGCARRGRLGVEGVMRGEAGSGRTGQEFG